MQLPRLNKATNCKWPAPFQNMTKKFSFHMITMFSLLGGSWCKQSTILHVFGRMERVGCQLGITLGYIFGYEWCTNSLVQHHKLACRCVFLVRYSNNDHDKNFASRHREIQYRWQLWRHFGRNWLEISTWWCFPTTKTSEIICSHRWKRHSDLFHGFDNNL